MKLLLPITLVLVAAAAFAQPTTQRVTLDLPADVYRAAIQRTGGEKEAPAETRAAVEAWTVKRITDDLAQELTALRLADAAKVEEDDAVLRTLTPQQCAAITKALGKPLKRCAQ